MLRTADGDVILFDAREAKAQATLVRSLAIERLLSGGAGTGRRAITSIACGADHSLALSADGTLFTWGDGGFGCLGHGDLADGEGEVKVPRLVEALSSHRVLSISASGRHCACVVAGDQYGSRGGSVWTWGRGNNGRLGHGSATPRDACVPTRIREFAPRASDVAQTVTRAIRSGGLVSDVRFPKVIGRLYRSVFIGSEAVNLVIASGVAQSRAAAVAVLARLLNSGVFSAAPPPHSGAAHFKDDYSFYRFASDRSSERGSGGDTVDGSSGSGAAARRATAASDGGASAVAQVTCGWNFTLFLTLDGAVYACGRGVEGQCGIEPAHDCFEPTPLAPIERRVPLSIAQSTTPPRATNKSGSAQSRYSGGEGGGVGRGMSGSGDELSGSLLAEFESAARAEVEERDSRGFLLSPADASPGSSPEKRGRAGAVFDSSSGGATAAGSPLQRRQRAASAEASAERFVSIEAGYSYALALTTEGVIFSWGSGDFGQLGTLTVSAPLPQRVPLSSVLEDGDVVESVSAGLYHAAARTIRGRVLVWGLNKDGRLGLGDCRDRVVPTAVPREWLGPRRSVSSVSCAANSTIFVHDETLQDGRSSPSFEVQETVPIRAASGSVLGGDGDLDRSGGARLSAVLAIAAAEEDQLLEEEAIDEEDGVADDVDEEWAFEARNSSCGALPLYAEDTASGDALDRSGGGTTRERRVAGRGSMMAPHARSASADSANSASSAARLRPIKAPLAMRSSLHVPSAARARLARSSSCEFDFADDAVERTSATPLYDARWRTWSAAVGNDMYVTPYLYHTMRARFPSTVECDAMGDAGGGGATWPEGMRRQVRAILVDLPRTLPQLPGAPFARGGCLHAQLLDILLAFIALRPDIGYVQGMGHVAGMIAVHFIHVDTFEAKGSGPTTVAAAPAGEAAGAATARGLGDGGERAPNGGRVEGAAAAADGGARGGSSGRDSPPLRNDGAAVGGGADDAYKAFACFLNIVTMRAQHFLPFFDLHASRMVHGTEQGVASIAIKETTKLIGRLVAQVAPEAHRRLAFLNLECRMWAYQLLQTAFVLSPLDLADTAVLWDLFVREGSSVLVRAAAAIVVLLEPALTRTTADWLEKEQQRKTDDALKIRSAGMADAHSECHVAGDDDHAGHECIGADGDPLERGRRRADSVGLSEQDGDGMVLGYGGCLKLLQAKGDAEKILWRRTITVAKIVALISSSAAQTPVKVGLDAAIAAAAGGIAPPLPARNSGGGDRASLLSSSVTVRQIDLELRRIRRRTMEGRQERKTRTIF